MTDSPEITAFKINAEKKIINDFGYAVLADPWRDEAGRRVYKLKTPCGHEWVVRYNNFLTSNKKAKADGTQPPCSICGGKARAAIATKFAAEAAKRRQK